jgi:hypothetical protein
MGDVARATILTRCTELRDTIDATRSAMVVTLVRRTTFVQRIAISVQYAVWVCSLAAPMLGSPSTTRGRGALAARGAGVSSRRPA